ncbi:MAG: thioredoxin domain-containing protein, partial [Saprospiraceae bacterium]
MTKSLFIVFLLVSVSIYSQGIEFEHTSWQDALEKAKEENKPLFVDAYAKWCGPCKRMAKNEFVKAEVGEIYNASFINLKLDMETKNGRTFGSKYPVSAYPTMFFLDGEGNVLKKIRGGKKGEQLIEMAKSVVKNHDTSGAFKEKYDAGDRSFDVMYSYIEALNKAGKPSLKFSNDYINSKPELTEEQLLKFYYIATVDADSKIFDKMAANKNKIIGLITAEAFDKKVKSACNNTVNKAIEYETKSLLTEALQKAENNLTEGEDIFVNKAKMKYAQAMNNKGEYTTAVKNLSKLYLKSNPTMIKDLINNIFSLYGKDADMVKMATGFGKKYYKKTKSVDAALMYVKGLLINKDFDKATSVLEKA